MLFPNATCMRSFTSQTFCVRSFSPQHYLELQVLILPRPTLARNEIQPPHFKMSSALSALSKKHSTKLVRVFIGVLVVLNVKLLSKAIVEVWR